jgi:probable rRNA maturation factor
MLHLLGYDHIEDDDRALMRKREEYFLEKMGQRR